MPADKPEDTGTRHGSRLIVVSNRLPVSIDLDHIDGPRLRTSDGGLVAAMAPVLKHRGGTWIGWPGFEGNEDDEDSGAIAGLLRDAAGTEGYTLEPVWLTKAERHGFYMGFSNEVIWPVFHDLQSLSNFDPAYWQAYRSANRRYAQTVARVAVPGDLVWVHDYHLFGVRQCLRELGVGNTAAFFLHIPFPAPDIFMKLPWRRPILEAILDYDLVGFQTVRDRRNFLDCVKHLMPEVRLTGRGKPMVVARIGEREVRVGTFPISIDYNALTRAASAPEVIAQAEALMELLPNRQLLLGVDRLDYTKGIPERLLAFANALERYPELRARVTLIQVVVPSRAEIPRYFELKHRIENLVGEINGRFTQPGGWVPIHYVFRALGHDELLAYYRAAGIALVTPLKDGMNLVAKEFCTCSPNEEGVLILSEFAGAAAQMTQAALLVNPYAVEEVANAIHRACLMGRAERRSRMRRLRRGIRRHDVFWWVDSFLRAAAGRDATAYPAPREHMHGN